MQIPFFGTSTKGFSLSLSLRSVYFLSLLDMGSYLPRSEINLHHRDRHALIEFDGVISCWSLRWCCYVRCSGSLAWSSQRIFWVEFYFYVCVGCYVWLPRNSKKIWEVFFFFLTHFKFFVLFF